MAEILISGGAGFIGSRLALKLVASGHKVRVLDNLSPQIHGDDPSRSDTYRSIRGSVDFIQGDVRSESDWRICLQDVDAVIHLAAETGTGQSMYEIKKYTDVNAGGTAILLDFLANHKHRVKKVIVASSRAIYGEGRYRCSVHGSVFPLGRTQLAMSSGDFEVKCPYCGINVVLEATDESSLIHPTSIYGITKQVQEQMVLVSCATLGIAAVALRYQNVYGPGQSLRNPYTGILSIFSTQMLANKPISIFEDGTESRDFVHVDDVVHATILALERDSANGQSYNVGTGVSTDVLSVATTLKQLYQSHSEIRVTGNFRLGDIRHNFADVSLAKRDLGFQAETKFTTGISGFVDWVKSQEVDGLEQRYDQSLQEMKTKGLYK